MVLALVLGLAVSLAGAAVVHRRGRAAGATVVGLAGAAVVAAMAATAGREAVGDVALGALVGLPALLAALIARDRADRDRPTPPAPVLEE